MALVPSDWQGDKIVLQGSQKWTHKGETDDRYRTWRDCSSDHGLPYNPIFHVVVGGFDNKLAQTARVHEQLCVGAGLSLTKITLVVCIVSWYAEL